MNCGQAVDASHAPLWQAVSVSGGCVAMRLRLVIMMGVLIVIALLAPREAVAAVDAMEMHAHHHMAIPSYARTVANYAVPDVTLVREDGKTVQLGQELDDGRSVVLSFIYTSCTTVCPMTSATLSQLQEKLGPTRDLVHLVSISIDPEFDTPARLRDYAAKYGAGPEWQHYTGSLAASQRSQRAFDVYRGNKMDHVPVTLVRIKPGMPWVRIDGFATADQLMAELPVIRSSK